MARCGDPSSTLCPPSQAFLNPFPTCVQSLSLAVHPLSHSQICLPVLTPLCLPPLSFALLPSPFSHHPTLTLPLKGRSIPASVTSTPCQLPSALPHTLNMSQHLWNSHHGNDPPPVTHHWPRSSAPSASVTASVTGRQVSHSPPFLWSRVPPVLLLLAVPLQLSKEAPSPSLSLEPLLSRSMDNSLAASPALLPPALPSLVHRWMSLRLFSLLHYVTDF